MSGGTSARINQGGPHGHDSTGRHAALFPDPRRQHPDPTRSAMLRGQRDFGMQDIDLDRPGPGARISAGPAALTASVHRNQTIPVWSA